MFFGQKCARSKMLLSPLFNLTTWYSDVKPKKCQHSGTEAKNVNHLINHISSVVMEKVLKFPLAAFLQVKSSTKRVRDSRHSSVY